MQAVKAGWALEFKSSELSPDTAHQLTAAIGRMISDTAFAQKAATVRTMLRAHPQLPVERAAGARWSVFSSAQCQSKNMDV